MMRQNTNTSLECESHQICRFVRINQLWIDIIQKIQHILTTLG
jgi:hypothetical protein